MFDLTGKIAVVSGGAKGIGRGIVTALKKAAPLSLSPILMKKPAENRHRASVQTLLHWMLPHKLSVSLLSVPSVKSMAAWIFSALIRGSSRNAQSSP